MVIKQHIHIGDGVSSSSLCGEEKQEDGIVERWLAERFEYKLRNASLITKQTHRPIVLYRNTIEESESALQEQIGLIAAYGGFVPSTFQKIEVHTIEKFITSVITKGKRDLLLQCLQNINKIHVVN